MVRACRPRERETVPYARLPMGRDERSSRGLTAASVALVVLPLAIAAAVLHGKHWWPTGDLAQAEMRVRSLWAHPPLIGAAGRLGTLTERGSHPGPLAYWLLWPVYRLFGATPWALEGSVAALNAAGAGVTILVARRIGGRVAMLGAALGLAGLLHGFGLTTMIQPWNPFLPLVWFAATVVLTWGVIAGDTRLWFGLVAVGTLCVQCHVGYLGPVGGLLAVALAFTVWRQRTHWKALLGAAGLGVVPWVPPIIDQIVHHPGNLRILFDYFRHPPENAIGLGRGLATVFRLLNPAGGWITGNADLHASVVPGVVLVAVWAIAAVWTWRRRADLPRLFALHVTVGAALVFSVLSVSRIFGQLFGYLVMWVWVITAAMVAATVASAAAAVVVGQDDQRVVRWRRPAAWVAVGAVAASSLALASSARGLRPPYEAYSKQMAALVPALVPKLARDGRSQVVFDDPISLGGDAYGLILELDRRGFVAGAPPVLKVAVEPHRVLPTKRATATLVVASGPAIMHWEGRPDARLLVIADPRTDAQRARYTRLRARAIAGLRRANLPDLVPKVDDSIWLVANDTRTPPSVIDDIGPMIDMGLPTAVFETAPGADSR